MDIPRLLDGRLKLRHLILVDALSEQGSVVGAAAALHVTQPVATRALQELEGIVGVQLYERGPRGITPTVFGVAFTEHARSALAQLTQAARHISEIAAADRGTVLVGTHLAGSNMLLPRAIAALKAEHPLLTVVVNEATPETLLIDLQAGRLDVIVGRLTGSKPDGTVRRKVYDESVKVVVGTHHPVADLTDVSLSDLLEFPWILPGTRTVLRREIEEYFEHHSMTLPTNRVEATSFLTVRQLLIDMDVVAILPGSIVRDDLRLTTLPIVLGNIGHRVGMTMAADRPLSPAGNAMVAKLVEAGQHVSQSDMSHEETAN